MRKTLSTVIVAGVAMLVAGSLQAGLTLFDLVKDSVNLVRGEFVALERTNEGDRLLLRCDVVYQGLHNNLEPGMEVWLEPFEPAPADAALGRDVIVGFNPVQGKNWFNAHPEGRRSFYFEESDAASNGLAQNEIAIQRLIQINAPWRALINEEVERRIELDDLSYPGTFPPALLDAWKAELLEQMSWAGTVAARDAAKAFIDHPLFRFKLTKEETIYVGGLLDRSQPASVERGYMIDIIRNENEAHPDFLVLMTMLKEDRHTAVVGKLSNLFFAIEDREMVIAELGALFTDQGQTPLARRNALQVTAAIRDKASLPFVHQVLMDEAEAGGAFDKNVVRGAMYALKRIPDESSVSALEEFMASQICQESWELTRRAWVAFSLIDSDYTNSVVTTTWRNEGDVAKKRFFRHLLPSNKLSRQLVMIHNED